MPGMDQRIPEELAPVLEDMKPSVKAGLQDRFGEIAARFKSMFCSEEVEETQEDSGLETRLSEDEEDMLNAYRSFKQRTSGGVFKWHFQEKEPSIVLPVAPKFVVDPRDVSEV